MTDPQAHDSAPAPARLWRLYRGYISAVSLVSMVGIVALTALQVVSRYAFQSSLFWPDEAARILLIALTFLLAGASYMRGEMIGVGFFAALFGGRVALVFAVLAQGLTAALLVVLIWFGWKFAEMNAMQHAAALQISVYWIYLAVPVGLAILLCHVLASLAARGLELIRGAPRP